MVTSVSGAKLALLDFDLRKLKMSMGVQVHLIWSARMAALTLERLTLRTRAPQVLVTDPSKLQAIRDREEDIMKERIELILKAVCARAE